MKSPWIACLLIGGALVAGAFGGEGGRSFAALAEDYAAKAEVVRKLDVIELNGVKLEETDFAEAIHQLQRLGSKDWPGTGVIHLVVRSSPRFSGTERPTDADGPFGSSSDRFRADDSGAEKESEEAHEEAKPGKVSLEAESISFAKAIDELCLQVGMRWEIDLPEMLPPVLVIKPGPGR